MIDEEMIDKDVASIEDLADLMGVAASAGASAPAVLKGGYSVSGFTETTEVLYAQSVSGTSDDCEVVLEAVRPGTYYMW